MRPQQRRDAAGVGRETGQPPTDVTPPDGVAWYRLAAPEAARRLQTAVPDGLSCAAAARRLAEYGPNELRERGRRGAGRILADQFASLLVGILVAALVLSAVLGDYKDSAAIGAIVVLNALLGFVQEHRAERALAALRRLAVPTVRARRAGHVVALPARELVPGDVVLLDAGALVPADGRVVEAASLRVQEAALTGESEAVDKTTGPLADDGDAPPLGDRQNMVFKGTVVVAGRGAALVTATGMATELGRIAALLQGVDRQPTPLQRRLDHLGRALAGAALALVGVVFVAGLLRGEAPQLMLLTAISMAVAAVPEGLPAVVTIALALGAQRMLKRRALVRTLAAVETLGSVTVICSDKTGTLTENRMAVAALAVLDARGHRVACAAPSGAGSGALLDGAPPVAPVAPVALPALALLLAGGALCNDAADAADAPTAPPSSQVAANQGTRTAGIGPAAGEPPAGQILGEPTEAALVAAARQAGLRKADLERSFPRVGEAPFDSDRKRMTTVHALPPLEQVPAPLRVAGMWASPGGRRDTAHLVAFTKGAPDGLLARASSVWIEAGAVPLTAALRARLDEWSDRLASEGMRVLGLAYRLLDASESPLTDQQLAAGEALERDLTFVGLFGLLDPPRAEARAAVATARAAGIRPVMITGDHPLTAQQIAARLGLDGGDGGGRGVTGPQLAGTSAEDLARAVDEVAVYARVSPEHKLTIVRALQARGHVVAMTGDGVNDAPALKQADVGVAMGVTGTDVAKEAADVVLLDDNFATIVAAVAEGRVIYDNVRKFVRYMMTTNAAELGVMLAAPFIGMPLPLLPLQILWVNLVTDGPPAVALGFEPAERDTMRRPPHPPDESIFARGMGRRIVWAGCLMAALTLAVGYGAWSVGQAGWQTMTFTTLVLAQMAGVLAMRSERDSLFRIGAASNRPLLGAVGLVVLLQAAVVYVPALQHLFHTTALSAGQVAVAAGASSLVFVAIESEKWLIRRQAAHAPARRPGEQQTTNRPAPR
jgi:Ca2+-transporting ATPase